MLEDRGTVPADRRMFVRSMNRVGMVRLVCFGWALAMCATVGVGQERGEQLPDAPVARTSTAAGAGQDLDVSWKTLPKRILRDQKDIWLFPFQLALQSLVNLHDFLVHLLVAFALMLHSFH